MRERKTFSKKKKRSIGWGIEEKKIGKMLPLDWVNNMEPISREIKILSQS